MKRIIYILICLLPVITVYGQQKELLLSYKINCKNTGLPIESISLEIAKDVEFEWGDGKRTNFSPEQERLYFAHAYTVPGEFIVNIYGEADAILTLSFPDPIEEVYQISSMVIKRNDKMISAVCHSLIELDVSNAISLEELVNVNGYINSLDLSKNLNIEYLNINNNPIEKDKAALLKMIESLPDRAGKEAGILKVNMGDYPRYKAICERKNWMIR